MSLAYKIEENFREINEITRIRTFGEVFTPLRFVKQMCDMLDADTWSNPTTVLIEPTAGDGVFVVEMLRRRFAGLGKGRSKRTAAALAITSMWAVDIQADNADECRANVLRAVLNHLYPTELTADIVRADIVYLAAIIAAIEHHIVVDDGLKFTPDRPSFLALPETEQKRAATVQMAVLRSLLRGRPAISWVAQVFHA